jgi:O-antigen ligase
MTAHKNSGNAVAVHWQSAAVFYSVLLMITSLYISRGVLSVAIIIFLLFAIIRNDIRSQLKKFIATPSLICFSLLFFIPFASGLWSSDIDNWVDVVRIKLPLLFFPIAFAGSWRLSQKQWLVIAYAFLFVVCIGCAWGLVDYAQNSKNIHEGYLRAKTILTPLEDDHVRFGWLASVAVVLCLLLFEMLQQKKNKVLLILLAAFFVIYLHVLSGRTGVLSLYIFLFLYANWLLFKLKKRKWSALLLVVLITLPISAYFLLPTFKARIQYNYYDLSLAKEAQYLPGSSDGARTMSLKAGWQMLQQNPLGVGAGDIMNEADKWYAANVPHVLQSDKFYPSSEWLMYGGFAGWPGVIAFTVLMLVPFFVRIKQYRLFWIAFHATAAFSFVFDMGLEVQYGVFLYAFISGWWWKWLNVNGESPS